MSILGPEGVHAVPRVAPIHLEMRTAYVEAPVARQLGLHDGQVVQATATVVNHQLKLVLNDHIFNLPLQPYIKEGDIMQLRAQLLPAGKWPCSCFIPATLQAQKPPPRVCLRVSTPCCFSRQVLPTCWPCCAPVCWRV